MPQERASRPALREIAVAFRKAIERTRAEKVDAQLPYFPDGACKMVSCLFAMHLRQRGASTINLVSGHVPGWEPHVRHHWLHVDGMIVDLTADPFGQPAVVVELGTPFHDSLDERQERSALDVTAAFTPEETRRYHRWLRPIEARMPGFSAHPG